MLSNSEVRPARKGNDVKYVLNARKSAEARAILDDRGPTFNSYTRQVPAAYDEKLYRDGHHTATCTTLKKIRDGRLILWENTEGFRPGRFNPDNIRSAFARQPLAGLTGSSN